VGVGVGFWVGVGVRVGVRVRVSCIRRRGGEWAVGCGLVRTRVRACSAIRWACSSYPYPRHLLEPEHRQPSQQDIPHCAAAERGDRANKAAAKRVHARLAGHEAAGGGERRGANVVERNQRRRDRLEQGGGLRWLHAGDGPRSEGAVPNTRARQWAKAVAGHEAEAAGRLAERELAKAVLASVSARCSGRVQSPKRVRLYTFGE
jgi:hypothetical protein